jgi:hypothetical protein
MHVWRLGPGHLGAILSIVASAAAVERVGSTTASKMRQYFEKRIRGFKALSHVTIEVTAEKDVPGKKAH